MRGRSVGSAAETTAYALALAVVALPLLVVSTVGANAVATVLTGFDEGVARDTAASILPWLVVAAIAQLFAGLAASALAALDDYATAAAGYAVGSVVGLVFIVWRVGDDGIDAVAWGMALNAAESRSPSHPSRSFCALAARRCPRPRPDRRRRAVAGASAGLPPVWLCRLRFKPCT